MPSAIPLTTRTSLPSLHQVAPSPSPSPPPPPRASTRLKLYGDTATKNQSRGLRLRLAIEPRSLALPTLETPTQV